MKFYLYSQLEIITAKMLGKYVPTGTGTGARVIQLGGGTRELYYYPKDVVLVTNVGEKVNKGVKACWFFVRCRPRLQQHASSPSNGQYRASSSCSPSHALMPVF